MCDTLLYYFIVLQTFVCSLVHSCVQLYELLGVVVYVIGDTLVHYWAQFTILLAIVCCTVGCWLVCCLLSFYILVGAF